MFILGQVQHRRFNINKMHSSGGWVDGIKTIEAEFKLVQGKRIVR